MIRFQPDFVPKRKRTRVSVKEKLSQMKAKSEQTKKEPDMAKKKSKEASL